MKVEGILPASESSHAIKAAIDEALVAKKTGEKKVILFGLLGTGYFDITAFTVYNGKTMNDFIPTNEDIAKNLSALPDIPQNR
jgi:tryptophan synthase beta chain